MKRIVILGGGESGVGAAVLAKQKAFAVFLSDQGKIKPKYKKILQKHSIPFEDEGHTTSEIFKADIVIKSPGIPDDIPLINNLRNQGIEVISEIEFAYRFTKATIIAITGSNGKTTVTKMVYHILKQAHLSVAMVGNVGDSFAMHIATQPEVDNYVIEVSSFQLDNCVSFKPHISILTNITPDHLDRYDNNFHLYRKAKFKILQNQGQDDFFIYNEDDLAITEFLPKISTNVQLIPFSKKQLKQNIAAFIEQNTIKINLNQQKTFNMSIDNLNVKGAHNAQNAMAASTAARLLKIRKQTIRESMESFRGVEHRLEEVKVLNNVNYINDSKATNINATFYALDSMTKPTVWIVGGVDKGNNYQDLLALVNERVKAIVCLGIDNSKIIEAFGKTVDEIIEAANMADAVLAAQHFSSAGDTVLLSPACASFDLFENYEDRGRQFKECVRKL
ncbi:UDP-N-acetylmuramoyl-L-alanine--D-glutamate ligase [Psychroflexus sp. ALD_RP9]|uniref:UDP-N-acetylmuramoyl-L-alanine--D-glutamate ligase n=1 Tax=Psychroflexus sp. ALD_RP9 TaxID=2777186 RepID=UPI001A8DCCB6|nr:UDP-N-acetylmuramoyl-L-alanine--D-glutamate ligase [Psychroflexus sp. ALD_RP9]QSS96505.1 UDP-N-acetylmuramoyl-L-alanine--D-glutamate ligase [Psychroflexus sp. ALD_RP9]